MGIIPLIFKWQYASAASQLCSCLIHKENKYQSDNPKRHFRTVTLQLLQQNFKKRTDLRKEEGKFLGLVSYIAGLYRVRIGFKDTIVIPFSTSVLWFRKGELTMVHLI